MPTIPMCPFCGEGSRCGHQALRDYVDPDKNQLILEHKEPELPSIPELKLPEGMRLSPLECLVFLFPDGKPDNKCDEEMIIELLGFLNSKGWDKYNKELYAESVKPRVELLRLYKRCWEEEWNKLRTKLSQKSSIPDPIIMVDSKGWNNDKTI